MNWAGSWGGSGGRAERKGDCFRLEGTCRLRVVACPSIVPVFATTYWTLYLRQSNDWLAEHGGGAGAGAGCQGARCCRTAGRGGAAGGGASWPLG